MGTTIEQSSSVRKNNPYLLQGDEEQKYEEANDDTDLNAEVDKINEDNNGMVT